MSEYNEKQVERLWEHGRQEETLFNERLTFFLIIESVLLGVTAALLDHQPPNQVMARTFLILGLALTLVWFYIQRRQLHWLNFMRKRMMQHMPEYKALYDEWDRKSFPLSSRSLLTYVVPPLFILMWVTLQFMI